MFSSSTRMVISVAKFELVGERIVLFCGLFHPFNVVSGVALLIKIKLFFFLLFKMKLLFLFLL